MDSNAPEIIKIGDNCCIVQMGNSFVKETKDYTKLVKDALNGNLSFAMGGVVHQNTNKGSVEVAPFGVTNAFPSQLLSLIANDYKALQLNVFNADQIYGAGPMLVNRYTQEEADAKEAKLIYDWLEGWGYEAYLQALIADYSSLANCFSEIILSSGAIVKGFSPIISSLHHLEVDQVRLEMMSERGRVENVVVGDWSGINSRKINTKFIELPIFDITNPKKHNISVYHAKRKVSGYPYYSYPAYFGVLNIWLSVANAIPLFHKSLLENGINAKYHIEISQAYIDSLVTAKKSSCAGDIAKMNSFTAKSVFNEEKRRLIDELSEVMSGAKNAGKFFASGKYTDSEGKSTSVVTITPIENKIKELSEAHLKLNEQVNSEYCSAFSVDPNLASITIGSGKMSSGSDKLNSYNVHQRTKTPIPRKIVCEAVNHAIRINFPDKPYDLSFRSINLVKQEENKNGVKNDKV